MGQIKPEINGEGGTEEIPSSVHPPKKGKKVIISTVGYRHEPVIHAIEEFGGEKLIVLHDFPPGGKVKVGPIVNKIKKAVATGQRTIQVYPVSDLDLKTIIDRVRVLIQENHAAGYQVFLHLGGGAQRLTVAMMLASRYEWEKVSKLFYARREGGPAVDLPIGVGTQSMDEKGRRPGSRLKKSIEFENEDKFAMLKAEATLNHQNIGDFIITLLEFWKEHHNEKRKEEKEREPVETLNRETKEVLQKFPEDFAIKLTEDQVNSLKSFKEFTEVHPDQFTKENIERGEKILRESIHSFQNPLALVGGVCWLFSEDLTQYEISSELQTSNATLRKYVKRIDEDFALNLRKVKSERMRHRSARR